MPFNRMVWTYIALGTGNRDDRRLIVIKTGSMKAQFP